MKFTRLQMIFLGFSLVAVLGFATAGASGYRLVSGFSKTSWHHTHGPGIYPAPIIFFHK